MPKENNVTMNTEITFNNLPEAVKELRTELSEIKRLLLEKSNEHAPEGDTLLNIQQAAALLNLSVTTLYGYVSRAEIPVMKKSKRLYFSKKELFEFVKTGRKKTVSEIEAEAETVLANHKKKR